MFTLKSLLLLPSFRSGRLHCFEISVHVIKGLVFWFKAHRERY